MKKYRGLSLRLAVVLMGLVLLSGCQAAKSKSVAPVAVESDIASIDGAVEAYDAAKYDQAIAILNKMIADAPNDARLYNLRGASYMAQNKLDTARLDFDKAVKLTRNVSAYHQNNGLLLLSLEDYSGALEAFTVATDVEPGNTQAWEGQGLAYLALNKPELAYGMLDKAVRLKPEDAKLRYNRGVAAMEAGLPEDAMRDFTYYIAKMPEGDLRADAYNNRAVCNLALDMRAAALKDIGVALSLNPNSANYYYNRGLIWVDTLEYGKAIRDFTRAIARDPVFVEAYVNRGEANIENGLREKGCADLNYACKLGYCERLDAYIAVEKCEKIETN